MTNAEKLAEEWWNKGADEYDMTLFSDKGQAMLKELIHQIARRTREECSSEKIIDKVMNEFGGWQWANLKQQLKQAIMHARWEDEEYKD